jgi:signal transduction histidine kinase
MTVLPGRSQQERLAALYALSSRLGTTLELPLLLDQVMDAIIQLTGAERGFLVLVGEDDGALETVAARNLEQETIGGGEAQISRSIVERVIESGEPLLSDNAQDDERFAERKSVIGLRLRSIMCAPLRVRGRIIGAAFVDNRLQSGVFLPEDLQLLSAFANQAAIAIENARLFQQTDQALARRVEELTLFQRIDQQLNRSLDLAEVLDLALAWAVTITGADGGSIGLLQDAAADDAAAGAATNATGGDAGGAAALRLLAFRGANESMPPREIPLSHPVLEAVSRERGSVLTRNVTAALAIDGSPAATQLAVPIRRVGGDTGLITLESRFENAFGQEDITFIERLADRAAVAIENARLYQELHQANQAKSDFISLVTHELRIPMTSIRGYTDLLLGEIAGPLGGSQKEFVNTIRRNLDRMAVLVRDLSDINRIESGRMKFEFSEFDLNELVEEIARDFREAIEARQQTLTLAPSPSPLVIHADRTRIAQAVTNLVSNANKYTPERGTIHLRMQRKESVAEVAVIDDGIGIAAEDQARLFSQFFRSEDEEVRAQSGWGLGLSIVKKLVEAQGGQVTFSSTLGEGSTFTVTIPLVEGASDDR